METRYAQRPLDQLVRGGERLRFGMHRPPDERIAGVVRELLRRRSPVSVLELACGSSLPVEGNRQIGAPWLARRLATLFGAHLSLTLSDLRPSWRNAAQRIVHLSHDALELRALDYTRLAATDPTLLRELEAVLQVQERLPLSLLPALSPFLYPAPLELPLGQLVVLPSLDEGIEGEGFGLAVRGGVDLYHLEQHFSEGAFDLIYCRHLVPDHERPGAPWYFEHLRRFLRPGGEALIHVDGRPQLVHLRAT